MKLYPNLLQNEGDHSRITDNTFTSPTLEGETIPTEHIRKYIPEGLGEGTFRQVLLQQAPTASKIANGVGLVGAMAGIQIPDTTTREALTISATLKNKLSVLLKEPEVQVLGMVVMKTDWFAGDGMERTIWFEHFLAIMKSESEFIHPSKELGPKTPVSLAQVKPDTFVREVSLLNTDNNYKMLLKNKFLLHLSKLVRVPFNLFLNASGFQSVAGSFTVVPALHFMSLKEQLLDKFIWYKGRWTPIRADDAQSPVWQQIKDKPYMGSFYLGRQACLTLLHISPSFKILSHFKYPGRYLQDITNFMGFVHSTSLDVSDESGDIYDQLDAVKVKEGYLKSKTTKHRLHHAYDLVAESGTPLYAITDGKVTRARWENPSNKKAGWGRFIEIDHGSGLKTIYAHMKSFAQPENAQIKEGTLIGYSDNTGHSTGAHLHVEILKNGIKQNPEKYLRSSMDVRKSIKPIVSKITT